MRIVHIGKYYPPRPGGIENFVADLAREQARSGHDVTVLVHAGKEPGVGRMVMERGVRVRRVRSYGQLVYAPVAPGFGWALWRTLRRIRPDVVHVHMPNVSAFWLLLGLKGRPVVVHWHADVVASGFDVGLRVLYPLYRIFERALLRRADVVVATSQPYLDSSDALRGVRRKCRVVPLGLSPERVGAALGPTGNADRTASGEEPRPMIFSVGRFAYYKGYEHLVRAMVDVPEARLVIAGSGPRHEAVSRLVEQYDVPCRVSAPGHVDEVELRKLFAMCDVFCLPSIERTEAFGVVLLEAMAHARPLVTTAIPGSGVNWVNKHGETGLVVPPGDPAALSEALRWMMAHPEERQRMGERARKRFVEQFHIVAVQKAMDDVYYDALGREWVQRAEEEA